jgi:hypothetical protein
MTRSDIQPQLSAYYFIKLVYLILPDDSTNSDYKPIELSEQPTVNNEFERVRKEAAMAEFKALPQNFR